MFSNRFFILKTKIYKLQRISIFSILVYFFKKNNNCRKTKKQVTFGSSHVYLFCCTSLVT
jgi:hypothetical protein